MIHGTPREANSLSPVPSAARPSRTARRMLFSFTCHLQLRRIVGRRGIRPHSPGTVIILSQLYPIVEECVLRSTCLLATAQKNRVRAHEHAGARGTKPSGRSDLDSAPVFLLPPRMGRG